MEEKDPKVGDLVMLLDGTGRGGTIIALKKYPAGYLIRSATTGLIFRVNKSDHKVKWCVMNENMD